MNTGPDWLARLVSTNQIAGLDWKFEHHKIWLENKNPEPIRTYTVLHLSCILRFLGFRIPVHLNTEVISIFLPVHTTVCHAEEITDTFFLSTWHLYNGYSGRYTLLFWHPVGYVIVSGTPSKISINVETKQDFIVVASNISCNWICLQNLSSTTILRIFFFLSKTLQIWR